MNQVKAKLIKYSENPQGKRIATFEWEYQRWIHSEVMTHRVLSKNAASSRAIPAKKVRAQVLSNPAVPAIWTQNKAGMSAEGNLSPLKASLCSFLWKGLSKVACASHYLLEKLGLHKQHINRILEPWVLMKIVVTATEWNNFIWLRLDGAAQPELQELASQVKELLDNTEPDKLEWGQWHLPYVELPEQDLSHENQMAVSISGCAQVSYRVLDLSMEKAHKVVDMLTSGDRVHASPFEHQARAVDSADESMLSLGLMGFTHVDVDMQVWSGNLCGWVQNRQLVPNNVKVG